MDDSWDLEETMRFHVADRPYGLKIFNFMDPDSAQLLTPSQQSHLNVLRRDWAKDNQIYLNAHPEIRGLIAIILRLILRKRPKTKVLEIIAEYFTRPSGEIKDEVYSYLGEREKLLAANSTIIADKTCDEESELSFQAEDKYGAFDLELSKSSLQPQNTLETPISKIESDANFLEMEEDDNNEPGAELG